MGYFNFPHTRTYDTDLGWLIKEVNRVKELLNQYLENAVITFADPITWDITEQYTALTCVIDSDGTAYLSKQPVPAGIDISNTDYWLPIFNYDDNINQLRSQIAYNAERSVTTDINLSEGSLVFWNGVLYRVLADMSAGTPFIIGTNIEAYIVDRKIDDVKTAAETAIDAETNAREAAIEAETTARVNAINSVRSSITYNAGTNPVVSQNVYTNDLVYYDGNLYQAVTDIPSGATLVPGSNIQLRTVNEVLDQIRESIVPSGDSVSYANILDYGAVGDGVTDDTQALLDAIAAKGAVFFPSGVYVIRRANITGDVILHGNNATLKAADAGSGQPDRIITFTNARVLINDLAFEGLGIPSGTITNTPDLLYAENADLYFTKCRFRNIRTLDYNNPAENWWERFAVLLRGVDCNNIHFNYCNFYNVAGNEIFYIIPHTKTLQESFISFTNNTFESSNGMSLDFFAGTVIVQNNTFKDWNYIGSGFNIAAITAFIENNNFINCSFGSVFDMCEGGYWRCGDVYIRNNTLNAPGAIFCINDSENLFIEQNNVTCGSILLDVNVTKTSEQCAGMPDTMKNLTRFTGGVHSISDNMYIINFGSATPQYIIRLWGINVFAGVSDAQNSTALENAIIARNTIVYSSVINAASVIPILWNNYINNCSIQDNLLKNIPSSTDVSSAPHVLGLTQNYSRLAESIVISGNTLIRARVAFIRWIYKQYNSSSGTHGAVLQKILFGKNVTIGTRELFFSPADQNVISQAYDIINLQQPLNMVTNTTFWDYLSNNMNEGETRIFAFDNMTFKTVSSGIAIAVKNYDLSTNSFKVLVFSGSTILAGNVTVNGIT